MVDIHAHILPWTDDGSPDPEISVEMAEQAVRSGVDRLVMTPHCNIPDMFDNYNDDDVIRSRMKAFQKQVEEAGIPLQLYTGMEVFGTFDVPDYLKEGRLLTINDTGYLLMEFPFAGSPDYATEILHRVCDMGYAPIVAHPERYEYVQKDHSIVDYWIRMGCGIQVNKGSLLRRFGRAPYYCAAGLLEAGMVSCIASDAHHSEWRTTYMDEVRYMLTQEYGESYADFLTRLNPGRILEGKELLWPID